MYKLENGTYVDLKAITVIVPNAKDKSDTDVVAIIGVEGNRIGVNKKDLKKIKKELGIK